MVKLSLVFASYPKIKGEGEYRLEVAKIVVVWDVIPNKGHQVIHQALIEDQAQVRV